MSVLYGVAYSTPPTQCLVHPFRVSQNSFPSFLQQAASSRSKQELRKTERALNWTKDKIFLNNFSLSLSLLNHSFLSLSLSLSFYYLLSLPLIFSLSLIPRCLSFFSLSHALFYFPSNSTDAHHILTHIIFLVGISLIHIDHLSLSLFLFLSGYLVLHFTLGRYYIFSLAL